MGSKLQVTTIAQTPLSQRKSHLTRERKHVIYDGKKRHACYSRLLQLYVFYHFVITKNVAYTNPTTPDGTQNRGLLCLENAK